MITFLLDDFYDDEDYYDYYYDESLNVDDVEALDDDEDYYDYGKFES